MERSLTIAELAKALCLFQSKSKTVGYDANNPFFKSKYATLTALVSSTREELTKEGLAVTQLCEDEGSVTTMLIHTSGEFISSKLTLKPVKDDPQGRGSCLTYSRRYSYASILGLVSDDDDDGNHATGLSQKVAEKVNPAQIKTNPVFGLKERVLGTGISTLGGSDKFLAWRIDNDLPENLEKATDNELNHILNLLREIKVIAR